MRRYAMQRIVRYHLKPMQAPAFQRWALEKESLIQENAPEGWTYVGIWFTVLGFGRYDCEIRWELDDYDALGAGWGNETFQQLGREFFDFVDMGRDSETYLMKSAADVAVFE
jgi:hypothetical protein